MNHKRISLTKEDFIKLKKIISLYKETGRLRSRYINQLAAELENAIVVDKEYLPSNIVTIKSTVKYTNLKNSQSYTVTIVFPSETDEEGEKISIMTPLGTALIGEKEYTKSICYAPGGEFEIQIEKVMNKHFINS